MSFRDRVSLRDEMRGIIEEPLLGLVPKRFDFIGDVAVISIPQELDVYKETIAKKLVSMRGNTRAVLNKVSKLEGEHRVADFELLLGESAETLHRENGYTYRLDVRTVFFNPRLYWERGRIGAKVFPGESVLIPFCGVGPFVLPAAGKGARVLAIEKNPEACSCLKENVRLNRLGGQVTVMQGDAGEIFKFLTPAGDGRLDYFEVPEAGFFEVPETDFFEVPEAGFDRAIVPTPYGMDRFLVEILRLIRKGGYVHFYTFKTESQIPGLIETYEKMGLEVEFYRRCGNVAPGVSRWVFDLIKNKD
ncbi:class I SAM-dependent methyltransferase family protein [Methanosarcina sp. KYL-1]|uniref:class I SAM-dependent methyltransferase n=1 Tax=Methanosarcina sp. KYL-1 TaxID=2602068 RepID=UPI002100EF60|nr:class I SAM-dependent methyltransferase family protein [Methanosarcina sp. KYL-1]MCQ1536539.1 class I SAM-dependent methyltransferase family protein [Methanosarcina sp. KYL-1]